VNCIRVRQMLDAYMDRELDRATTAEIDAHLSSCDACTALQGDRAALSTHIRSAAPYFHAPEALRPAIVTALARVERERPRRAAGAWWRTAAFAVSIAIVSAALGFWLGRLPTDHPVREELVARHVDSLRADRELTEIASSDRHVVKPWFAGRVGFAPTVRDLSDQGYALIGARLDHLADRQASAVVYKIRNHYINLFAWPAARTRPEAIETATVRGFAMATWSEGGLRFAAVSDVDARDLRRFAELASAQF